MILLDTNVVSEMLRAEPAPAVAKWLGEKPSTSVVLCSITEAELRLGIALLPPGKRRDALSEAIEGLINTDFRGRILPFDSASAAEFAEIVATRRRAGRPISLADAQIAAIARSRGARVATRNVDDFAGAGVELVNPWDLERRA